jgi:hypothetical protein
LVNRELDPNHPGLASLERIFSGDFYLSVYPDVANAGVDPWEHFSKHGLLEGRAPSPYVDPRFLANNLGLPISDVLLEAFSNSKYWAANTSPHVDIRNFVVNGPWNGYTHPLEQLITSGRMVEPWVKFGDSYSDLTSLAEKNQRLLAISILHHVNSHKFRFSNPKVFTLLEGKLASFSFEAEERVFCIPGYVVCAQGIAHPLSGNNDLLSPDKSAVKHSGKLTLFESEDRIDSNYLVIAPDNLMITEAKRWVKRLKPDSVVVPASADQEYLLRYCVNASKKVGVRVMVYGVQSEISCRQLIKASPIRSKPRRLLWSPKRLRRRGLMVVADSPESLVANEVEVSSLIKHGARICVSNNQAVPFWLDTIRVAKVIVVCGKVSWIGIWVKKSIPIVGVEQWVRRE